MKKKQNKPLIEEIKKKESPTRAYGEKVANFAFALFLIVVFYFSYTQIEYFNLDILMYRDANLSWCYPQACHAMPILANLFYKIIPTELIILASPFAIVGIYLMPYWFVSKKIVYYFPALFMIPVLYTTLIASVMDFLFLPLVYNRLKNGLKLEAILLGLLMILFHGQYALFYLVILLFYMRKFKELAWICAIGVPLQILPITYFSQGYLTFILGIDWIYSFYGLFNFVANQFILRMIVHTVYILTFILLVRSES